MRKICAKFVPRGLREDQKKDVVMLINSDPAVLDVLVICSESWIYCYDPETSGSMLALPDPDRANPPTNF